MASKNRIERRVERSLKRLGCLDIVATDLGEGRIRIAGQSKSRDELPLIIAMVKTVPGVTSIEESLTVVQ